MIRWCGRDGHLSEKKKQREKIEITKIISIKKQAV